MLIKDRLQSVNNAILFSDISSYLFDVDVLLGLDQVFLKQFCYDTITKVCLN